MRLIYVPIADSFFESSIMRESLPVRFVMLALIRLGLRAGADGVIDVDLVVFAASLFMPVEDVEQAIKRLMEPDPNSGCPDEEGRRIVPVDPARPMRGWRLVNWSKYRDFVHQANAAARKRAERAAKALAAGREPGQPGRPPKPGLTRPNPVRSGPTKTNTKTKTRKERARARGARAEDSFSSTTGTGDREPEEKTPSWVRDLRRRIDVREPWAGDELLAMKKWERGEKVPDPPKPPKTWQEVEARGAALNAAPLAPSGAGVRGGGMASLPGAASQESGGAR